MCPRRAAEERSLPMVVSVEATRLTECPDCGNRFQLPPGLDGRRIRCKVCAAEFVVTTPRAEPAANAASPESANRANGHSNGNGNGNGNSNGHGDGHSSAVMEELIDDLIDRQWIIPLRAKTAVPDVKGNGHLHRVRKADPAAPWRRDPEDGPNDEADGGANEQALVAASSTAVEEADDTLQFIPTETTLSRSPVLVPAPAGRGASPGGRAGT